MHKNSDTNERLGYVVPFLATLSVRRIETPSLHGEYSDDMQMMVSIKDGNLVPVIDSQRDDVYFLTKTKVDMEADDDDSEMINRSHVSRGSASYDSNPLFLDLLTKTMAHSEEDDETKFILDE